jgi:mono/diheme cytochrome c family protein
MVRLLAFIGLLAIIAIFAGAIYFFGGFYNVAATEPDPGVVDWALRQVRMASVTRHAGVTGSVNLDDATVVQQGARAYSDRGCAACHGAPGVEWQKFSEGMRPDPPDLKKVSKEREPAQLFWVIKHGIKMSGMPTFGEIGAGDREIWTIVAFVKKLPDVSEADYKAWSAQP